MSNSICSEILDMLETDAKMSIKDMATMAGVSENEVKETIAKLEKEKVIVKYSAIVNREKVESDETEALIEVKVVPKRGLGYDDLAERIYRFPEVKSVYLMSGTYDLSVIVRAGSLKQVSQFVFERLAVLDGVSSTVTHFIMRKYKEHGVILMVKDKEERLVISP
ncbi:MAG: Lrp/AsnC family transcriptional regulator [Eubacteriales bacterium]|nr:Lrp/AsnC family transcriptional regulator [Eubacteriales bacterium]